jgi:hypothetical protein
MLEINLTGAFRLYCKAYKMEGLTEIRHPSNRLQHKEPGVTAVTVETVEYRHHRILQEKKKQVVKNMLLCHSNRISLTLSSITPNGL